MFFSIVVPIYNVGQHLPSCLESISNQSFNNFEVILVNDGSTDNCLFLCEEYKNQSDKPVVIVNQENAGLLGARRAGIDMSSGDYIISLDGDDKLQDTALETIYHKLKKTDADVVCFGYSKNEDFSSSISLPLTENYVYSGREVRRLFCSTNKINSMCLKAIRSNLIGKSTDFKPYGKLNIGEDAIQSALVYDSLSSLIYIDKPLYYYRQNGASVSANFGRNYLDDIKIVHECLYSWVDTWQTIDVTAEYYDLITARCLEEVAHFLLHFNSNASSHDLRNAIDDARQIKSVKTYIAGYGSKFIRRKHTRIIANLLRKDNTAALQIMLQVYRKLCI